MGARAACRKKVQRRRWGRAALLALMLGGCGCAWADTGVDDQTGQQAFNLTAFVADGCVLGQAGDDPLSLGALDFGQHAVLVSDVVASTSLGQGSVAFRCTPGLTIVVTMNPGLHAMDVSGGRYLERAGGADTLRYQLFQDGGHAVVWGDGGNGGSAYSLTATGELQVLTVHGRLYAQAVGASGDYGDTVRVTVSF